MVPRNSATRGLAICTPSSGSLGCYYQPVVSVPQCPCNPRYVVLVVQYDAIQCDISGGTASLHS